jgi:hypothetical protein
MFRLALAGARFAQQDKGLRDSPNHGSGGADPSRNSGARDGVTRRDKSWRAANLYTHKQAQAGVPVPQNPTAQPRAAAVHNIR